MNCTFTKYLYYVVFNVLSVHSDLISFSSELLYISITDKLCQYLIFIFFLSSFCFKDLLFSSELVYTNTATRACQYIFYFPANIFIRALRLFINAAWIYNIPYLPQFVNMFFTYFLHSFKANVYGPLYYLRSAFAQSSLNCWMPLSVSGCLNIFLRMP